jgi:CLIP-associating protein 1/2
MEPETLMRCTPDLIPGLVEAFNSPSADVRKAVVDAMVSMYDSLGDWLLPQLSGLSPAQQKLVTIYINRAMEKSGGGGGGGVGAGGKGGAKVGAAGGIGDASRRPLAPRHQ